jgi:hypothetical protein
MTDPNSPVELFDQLDAGIFRQKVSKAFADVALGVAIHGKKGKVILTFDFDRIGESTQVEMVHKVHFAKPTERGKVIEENTTSTPLHVGIGGVLTVLETTGDLFTKRESKDV